MSMLAPASPLPASILTPLTATGAPVPPHPLITSAPIQTSPPFPSVPPMPNGPSIPGILIEDEQSQSPSGILPAPTAEPTTTGSPTREFMPDSDCLRSDSIRLGKASDESATPISLEIGYYVESNKSDVNDFMDELLDELIKIVLFAILDCNPRTNDKVSQRTKQIFERKNR